MASHFLLAIVLLSFIWNNQADLINDVCSKSSNPQLCTNTLRSNPSSRGADLRGLGLIIANKAISTTIATQNIAQSLTNGPNKDAASACVFYCKDAYVYLNTCPDFLRINQGNLVIALRSAVARAMNDLQTCDAKFRGAPGNLKSSSKQAQDFVNMLSVIGRAL